MYNKQNTVQYIKKNTNLNVYIKRSKFKTNNKKRQKVISSSASLRDRTQGHDRFGQRNVTGCWKGQS